MEKKSEKMKYVIGIDIGTTNIKGSLYDSEGSFMDSRSYPYESFCPQKEYHEQDPQDWVHYSVQILKELCKDGKTKEGIDAVSFSTQGGTVVITDKAGRPLRRAMTWLDRRGLALFEDSQDLQAANVRFYLKTGWRLDSCMGFMPLYWLRKNDPVLFSKIHKVMYVNDYLLYKLCGNAAMDPSNASISMFYNVPNGIWDADILKMAGLSKDHFSPVQDSGKVVGLLSESVKKEIGIQKDVLLVNGGHDQYCAAIGAGIINEDEMLLSTGTAWVLFKLLNEAALNEKNFFAIGRNIIDNKFGLICSIPAAGASIKWFAKNIMRLKSDMVLVDEINADPKKILDLKNNILFYPYLTGSHGPDFDPDRKASFKNMQIGHNYLDMAKAIYEGICFQLKKIMIEMEKNDIHFREIKMVGGGAKSRIWPDILADITNKDILIPIDQKDDFTTKGAAIIAGFGAKIFSSFEDGIKKTRVRYKVVTPNKKNKDFYDKKFAEFLAQ